MKNTQNSYYVAPSDEIFEDIQNCAVSIWLEYDDTYGYASGKIKRVKSLENFKDNAWTIVAMFDGSNQAKLLERVKPETADAIINIIKGV